MEGPAAQREMLALVLPARVEIVEPFTRVRSFDDDEIPDGIELLLRAANSMDNPGLMIVGKLRVELYVYVPASGEPRGKRLEHWEVDLSTAKQQETYWNALTQMYEFHLGINEKAIPPAERYLLVVTYSSPLGQRLVDECTLDFRQRKARPAAERIGRR